MSGEIAQKKTLKRAITIFHFFPGFNSVQQSPEDFCEHIPENIDHELAYLSTICRPSTLLFCEGLHHLAFGLPDQAA